MSGLKTGQQHGQNHNDSEEIDHISAPRNGYAASKWASERVFERAAAEMGVPSTIYRFVPPSLNGSAPSSARDEAKAVLLAELGRLVGVSEQMPDMTGWSGQVDFMTAQGVASRLEGAILKSIDNEIDGVVRSEKRGTRFCHYESPISLRAEELRATLEAHDTGELGRMPLLKCFGRIKAHGFAYLLTSQDMKVDTGGAGQSVVESRR
ncbi:hypothetical protein KVR01_005801 [Diaporthe batatas]|uniref:uncharacterized protein n=1 Tax=Diaporthe batatas TaxID=748121 RepID=UPI001D03BE25|nr:uncharacterized protein KVR01_005801 [Diaporthe batatas]KAG8163883.1 hypothetical protein KVR01_005801 [Diaporthe batatas]